MDAPSYKVRMGTPLDHRKMMAFCEQMHAENGVARMNPKKIEAAIMCGLARHNAMIGIIDGDHDDVAASVGLYVSQWWYTDSMHVAEHWLFVGEPYRRRPMARPLLEFAKHAAKVLELPLVVGILSNVRTEAKVKLYERRLGKPMGAIFYFDGRPSVSREEAPALVGELAAEEA